MNYIWTKKVGNGGKLERLLKNSSWPGGYPGILVTGEVQMTPKRSYLAKTRPKNSLKVQNVTLKFFSRHKNE